MNNIIFDSNGNIVERLSGKYTNRLIRSLSKQFVNLSKFKKELPVKKSDFDIDNFNNKSEIKHLILDGNPIEVNITNLQEKIRSFNNYDSNITLIPKYKTYRIQRNSDCINELELSNQKSKSEFLDNN